MSENGSASDWVYVLLTLVAAGASLIKSASSKSAKKVSRPAEAWPTDLPIQENEEVANNTFSDTSENLYDFYPEEEDDDSRFVSLEDSPVYQEPQTREEEEEPEFDLKQAVINSEILNRKYN